MKWEYLQVQWTDTWIAFDGNSQCDGDESLIVLLNKLGQDRWEYCQFVDENGIEYHLLKRSIK